MLLLKKILTYKLKKKKKKKKRKRKKKRGYYSKIKH